MSTRVVTKAVLLALLISIQVGCTNQQLQTNTVRKADGLSDLYQQQVLDNVARFVYDAHSLPHFALPDQGTSQVVDTAKADAGIQWGRTLGLASAGRLITNGAGIGVDGTRQQTENWILAPITDPHKLFLMQCAYQQAVENCVQHADGTPFYARGCTSCKDRVEHFHAGHRHSTTSDSETSEELTSVDANGRLRCLDTECCWFGFGSKDDVPDDCGCQFVGSYCDVYVWVLPGGRKHLTDLTLTILDYAFYDPPAPLQQEVTSTTKTEFDKDGKKVKSTTTTTTTKMEAVVKKAEKNGEVDKIQFGPNRPSRFHGFGLQPLEERLRRSSP